MLKYILTLKISKLKSVKFKWCASQQARKHPTVFTEHPTPIKRIINHCLQCRV